MAGMRHAAGCGRLLGLGPGATLERYVAIMRRHLDSGARLFLYTTGGLLLEAVFAVVGSAVAMETGWR